MPSLSITLLQVLIVPILGVQWKIKSSLCNSPILVNLSDQALKARKVGLFNVNIDKILTEEMSMESAIQNNMLSCFVSSTSGRIYPTTTSLKSSPQKSPSKSCSSHGSWIIYKYQPESECSNQIQHFLTCYYTYNSLFNIIKKWIPTNTHDHFKDASC